MTRGDVLGNAIKLIKAGKNAEAQKLLEPHIEANLQDVTAWLCEAETWSSPEKKIRVLEMCLVHNPGDQRVEQALTVLNQKKMAQSERLISEGTSEGGRKKLGICISPEHWLGRFGIIIITIQVAILVVWLRVGFLRMTDNYGIPTPPITTIGETLAQAFSPLSWVLFPIGLLHFVYYLPLPRFPPPYVSLASLIPSFVPPLIHLSYLIAPFLAIFMKNRVAFWVFYISFAVIVILTALGWVLYLQSNWNFIRF